VLISAKDIIQVGQLFLFPLDYLLNPTSRPGRFWELKRNIFIEEINGGHQAFM
jgi:hypothetical protein